MNTDRQAQRAKTVHLISLGCPKNLVDSEMMLGTLKRDGYAIVDRPEAAETVIVNTCGFIGSAKEESISKILEMGELKEDGQLQTLVVAGCLAQRYQGELAEGLPEADIFIGSGEFQKIDKILGQHAQGKGQRTYFNLPTYLQEESTPRINSQMRHTAYLKISEGCKKRCAFCAIPLIRGNLQSRSIDAIVSEAKLLVAGGVRELNVVSHDFSDFGWDLRRAQLDSAARPEELLKRLADESGADWIRVLYLYPDGITDSLVEVMASRPNLVKYFDMPLQHINNRILKLMNRRMSRAEIQIAIDRIRQSLPEAVIRTQFIVGFPGETEEAFNELLDFVEEQKFDRVGCFTYSPEEGTKGATLPDPVEEGVKADRLDRLMRLQKKISRGKQRVLVGRVLPVMVEGISEETELLLQGRTSQQAPEVDGIVYINEGTAAPGDIVDVEITDSHDYDLVGRIVPS